jgi:F like protein
VAELEPQSIEELEAASEEYEALIAAGLVLVVAAAAEEIEHNNLSTLSTAVVDIITTLWNEYVDAKLIPALTVSMSIASEDAARALSSALGDLPFLNEPLDTQLYLAQAKNRLVGIGNELWFNARTEIAAGLAAGEDIPTIAQRVREAAGVTEPRARVIARTESHGARNTVNAASVRRAASAFGSADAFSRRWQAAEDARTRPTHVDADGQTVGLNEPFTVGGASLDFPGDPAGPPGEVINCRCTTITIIDVDALNTASTGTVTLNAAAYRIEDTEMPWSIVEGDERCDAGEFAVVKDADNELAGCHATRDEAEAQVAALYASEAADDADAAMPAAMRNTVPWSGVLVVEGTPTGDGRQFAAGALTWPQLGDTASLEIPLGWMYERAHGGMATDKVVNVGRIDTITRVGNELHGTGVINLDTEWGRRAAEQMGTREDPGFLAGVSIDADDPEDPQGLNVEYVFPDSCALEEAPDDAGTLLDDNDGPDMACMIPEMVVYHSGRIRAATLVDIPAYVEARLYLDQPVPEGTPVEADAVDMPITASSFTMEIPDLPPAEWFDEPRDEPEIGAITITDEGRIFGYLAPKNVAHRGIRDKRVTVPMGNVDYGIWMNRVTLADDGRGSYTRVATGPITMDCGHATASPHVVGAARREHYDNSCSIVATVRVGENSRGVWISGAVLPDVTPDQVRRMMACQLSGDWGPHREKPGKRELAGALLVPVPGFPKRSNAFMSMKAGQLEHVTVPVRFGRIVEPQTLSFNADAAAERIAASIGRDRASRVHSFAAHLAAGKVN